MSIPLNNMSNLLDNLHEITEDLQRCVESSQKPQLKLCYATISFLPENETTQELKSRCSHHGGIVSRNVKIFQKYINQSLKQQNLSF